jgi:hypothetical protein
MAKREHVTLERVKELLSYDPITGIWTWLVRKGKAQIGSVAGCLDGDGYVQIQIDYVQYKAHNLAFLWMTGRWPRLGCDHRDLQKTNNKWNNLREATGSQNVANQAITIKNTSGFKGVSFDKKNQKWRASVTVKGKFFCLGRFTDPEVAYASYCKAVKSAFGEFARTK